MLKSAPSPKKKTNPLIWVGLAVLAAVAYSSLGGEDPVVTTAKKTKKSSSGKAEQYLPADYEAKFAPFTLAAVDVFNPLIKKPVSLVGKDIGPQDKIGINTTLTGGEPSWYYTGVAELDGVRQGLLENTVSGETAYVGVGDAWKAAKIVSIDVGVIVMSGPSGGEFRVPIVQYGETAGASAPSLRIAAGTGAPQPLVVPGAAINGTIGGGLGVRPVGGAQASVPPNGQGMQAQNEAAVAANDMNNQGRGNRRNRRNRNTDQGTQGFNNVP